MSSNLVASLLLQAVERLEDWAGGAPSYRHGVDCVHSAARDANCDDVVDDVAG